MEHGEGQGQGGADHWWSAKHGPDEEARTGIATKETGGEWVQREEERAGWRAAVGGWRKTVDATKRKETEWQ